MTAKAKPAPGRPDAPVVAYKALLRDLIDRRPSGTRQRIAHALGKHKSFVSQITNPSYPVPVPAKHLSAIFEICHFSPEERRAFLQAYGAAHPRQSLHLADGPARAAMTLNISIPAYRAAGRQAQVAESIRAHAKQVLALAGEWDRADVGTAPMKPDAKKPSAKKLSPKAGRQKP